MARWISVVAIVILSFVATPAQAPADSAKTAADLIDYKAEVLAADPFAPSNQAGVAKVEFRRGEVIQVVITAFLKQSDAYTYPMTAHDAEKKASALNSIKWGDNSGIKPLLPISEPEPEVYSVDIAGIKESKLVYKKSPIVYSQELVILPTATPGTRSLKFAIQGYVCNSQNCVPIVAPLGAFDLPINVSNAPPLPLSLDLEARIKESTPVVQPTVPSAENTGTTNAKIIPVAGSADQHKAGLEAVLSQLETRDKSQASAGLLAFMLTGVFWGAVSLITPCVFPMIPITVSFFLKQSEKQHHKPVTMALVYCGTIIVVLTIAAVALLSFFRWLSVHPIMNFGLGALFIFFALSLFGMYEIELPSGLARFTSTREERGGLVGTMFMALTFTIVSFACVAPFLGGFGGTAMDSGITFAHRVLGGFAFAATFAAPFFVLALFPNLLKKMPKSGSWLNSVKVVMGFLELAAALKFMRAAELVLLPKPVFFTYDLVLGIWIAMCLLCGLYLLNFYRLPHDTPADHISVPRLLFGLAFISLGFYLLPAEFKIGPDSEAQRPTGTIYAWVDSFLLPEPSEGKGELAWSGNLKQLIDEARADAQRTGKRRLVFVDFTGETCTNCKINEKSVFTKSEIRGLFQNYLLAQLYTDKVPDKLYSSELRSRFGGDTSRQREDAAANLWFQDKAFGDVRLPLYVILEPRADGKIDIVGTYDEGKINSDAAFAQFLRSPFHTAGAVAQADGR